MNFKYIKELPTGQYVLYRDEEEIARYDVIQVVTLNGKRHDVISYNARTDKVLINYGDTDVCWWPRSEVTLVDDVQRELFK